VNAEGTAMGAQVWIIVGEEDANGIANNVIESGVTYGVEPRFATTAVEAEPLVAGQRYRVYVGATGPVSRFGFEGGGEAFFVQ
jgi:hypothetical protein